MFSFSGLFTGAQKGAGTAPSIKTPPLNPGGSQSLWDSMKSLGARTIVKAEAKFWDKFGKAADSVDRNVAQPALTVRNNVVGGVQTVAKVVTSPISITVVVVVLVLGVAGFFLLQVNRVTGK